MIFQQKISNLNLLPVKEKAIVDAYYEYEHDEDKRNKNHLGWRLDNIIPISQLLLEKRYIIRNEVKCLFVIVGTTIEPLLLSILTIRPKEKIIFIYSEKSKNIKVQVEATLRQINGNGCIIKKSNLLSKDAIKYIEEIINGFIEIFHIGLKQTTPDNVFYEIKTFINNNNLYEIGVDITGGKKSMICGGFLAAAINDYKLFYLDFDEYLDNEPKSCTEFINILDNPYDIYNIQLLNQAKKLFASHNYQAAYYAFNEVEKKMVSDNKLAKYNLNNEYAAVKNMRDASKCYMNWDRYSFDRALENKNCLSLFQKTHLNNLFLYDQNNSKKERYKSDYLYEYILDRILSAKRRWFTTSFVFNTNNSDNLSGYHDAILRYHQCVEIMMVAYITINEESSKYNPDDKQNMLSMNDIKDLCFKGVLSKKFKCPNCGDIEIKYNLKNRLSPPSLRNEITELINRRNEFVHVKPNNESADISEADNLVQEIIKQVFTKNEDELKNDLNEYTFKTRFDNEGNLI